MKKYIMSLLLLCSITQESKPVFKDIILPTAVIVGCGCLLYFLSYAQAEKQDNNMVLFDSKKAWKCITSKEACLELFKEDAIVINCKECGKENKKITLKEVIIFNGCKHIVCKKCHKKILEKEAPQCPECENRDIFPTGAGMPLFISEGLNFVLSCLREHFRE